MAMTPEQEKAQRDEFAAAFAEDAPAKQEMSEDEAFGLAEPAAEEAPAEEAPAEEPAAEAPADKADDAASAAEGGAQGEAPAIAVVIEPAAEEGGDVAAEDEPTDEKDVQRAKSWEGRLRAREAELKAREEALAARESGMEQSAEKEAEEGETPAEQAAETPAMEAAEAAADAVEAGEMSVDDAIKTLTEDFGPEFVKVLGVLIHAKAGEIAGQAADERVGKVGQTIDGLISELVDEKAKEHFETIADAHPDFMEIADSEAFKSFIDAMPEEAKATAMATIENGSARQINKLLSAFKASQAPKEEAPEPAVDAAEGVRSSAAGLRLPEEPKKAEGYEEAWEQF